MIIVSSVGNPETGILTVYLGALIAREDCKEKAPMGPTADRRPDPVELARRIRPAMTRLYVTYFRTAEQSTLSGPQLSILHRLEDDGPCRIRQLAEAEGVRMPTASNTINQLEKRGLVQRVRAEDDRRGVTVEITALGSAELKRVGKERTHFLAEMLATLDDVHLRQLADADEAVNALAQAYTEMSRTGSVSAGESDAPAEDAAEHR